VTADHDEEFVAEMRAGLPDVDLDEVRTINEANLQRLRLAAFTRRTTYFVPGELPEAVPSET
jgi:hypothetical protein